LSLMIIILPAWNRRHAGPRMTRSRLPIAAAMVPLSLFGVVECQSPQYTGFSYASHQRPRVFVTHSPILARPGTDLRFLVVPETRSDSPHIDAVSVHLRRSADGSEQVRSCQ